MSLTRAVLVIVLVGSFVGAAWLWSLSANSGQGREQVKARAASEPVSNKPVIATGEVTPKQGTVMSESTSVEAPSVEDVLRSPAVWVEKARAGDTRAAKGVHLATMRCFPLRVPGSSPDDKEKQASGCSGLPDARGLDRLQWLEMAAARGDVEAARMYAGTAALLTAADARSRESSPDAIDAVLDKARRYLDLAVAARDREALLLAHKAFQVGLLGRKDPIESAAYLYALAAIDSSFEVPSAVRGAVGRMRPGEQSQVESRAKQIVKR